MSDSFIRKGTEASVAVAKIWSKLAYAALKKNLVAANLVNKSFEGEIKQKGDRVVICTVPADLTVSNVSEGVAVDAVVSTLTSSELIADKHKAVHVAVSQLAQVQCSLDLMSEYSDKIGYNLSKQIDSDIITALKGASAAAPDHIIAGSGTAGAFNPLTDIITAKGLLDAQNVPAEGRFMMLNPQEYNLILAVQQVQSSLFAYGQPMVNGKITPIFGFTPYMSNQVTAGEVLFGHVDACAFAMQKDMNIATYDMRVIGVHADRLVGDVIYGVKMLDSKRVVLLNATGA